MVSDSCVRSCSVLATSALSFRSCIFSNQLCHTSLVLPTDVSTFISYLQPQNQHSFLLACLLIQDQIFAFCPGQPCFRLKGHSCLCSLIRRTRSLNYSIWLLFSCCLLWLFLGLSVYCFCRGWVLFKSLFLYSCFFFLCLGCEFENSFGETIWSVQMKAH